MEITPETGDDRNLRLRRNSTLPILLVAVFLFWILLIEVFPIYFPQIRGFGFMFPFFFFPFFGGRRYGKRPRPTPEPSSSQEDKKQDEFEYVDLMTDQNYRPSLLNRNYILYAIAGVLLFVGIYLVVTKIL